MYHHLESSSALELGAGDQLSVVRALHIDDDDDTTIVVATRVVATMVGSAGDGCSGSVNG